MSESMTLGQYLKMSQIIWGKDSPPYKFLEEKIKKQGADEPVLADETQMLFLLQSMAEKETSK